MDSLIGNQYYLKEGQVPPFAASSNWDAVTLTFEKPKEDTKYATS